MSQPKRRFGFRLTLGISSIVAAVMMAAGTLIILKGRDVPEITLPAPVDPVRDAIILLAVALVLASIVAIASRADRRCADDYAFQLLATGGFVGMLTMLFAHSLWALDFATEWLRLSPLYEPDLMALGMIGWGVAYFTFRIRGLK